MKELNTTEVAIFGAGCFWGVEENFKSVPGVIETEVGYCGGHTTNPTYRNVCSGDTGHAEVVKVAFDPAKVSFDNLLSVFWKIHDPTSLNKQGPDRGSQYRSAIFCSSDEQLNKARVAKDELEMSGQYNMPVVTEIKPAGTFYRAEEYHQNYYEKQGIKGCSVK